MKGIFVVSEISGDRISVTPYSGDSLEGPAKIIVSHIEVTNPKNFDVSVGTKVSIGLSRQHEGFVGIFSMLLPVAAAFFGLFASGSISSLFNRENTELFRFFTALIFFAVAYLYVIINSRRTRTIIKPQILGLVD